MTNPEIRYATRQDWINFFGKPPDHSVRALVGVVDGEILGIAGLEYAGEQMTAFSCYRPESKKYPLSTMKMGKRLVKMIENYGKNVLALADKDEPTAPDFLERLGFVFVGNTAEGRVYKWRG